MIVKLVGGQVPLQPPTSAEPTCNCIIISRRTHSPRTYHGTLPYDLPVESHAENLATPPRQPSCNQAQTQGRTVYYPNLTSTSKSAEPE